jgi:hypothetical protein
MPERQSLILKTNHDAPQKVTWMRKLVRETRADNLWNVGPPAEGQNVCKHTGWTEDKK